MPKMTIETIDVFFDGESAIVRDFQLVWKNRDSFLAHLTEACGGEITEDNERQVQIEVILLDGKL